MKALHRPGLYSWSAFDEARNVDFNGTAWAHPAGTVLFDPMPMSSHDLAHLLSLGPVAWVVITNSDHVRAASELVAITGARVAGPAAERDVLAEVCEAWLGEGDTLVPGLTTLAMEGSKTPGELALRIEDHTLVTGDLVRAHRAGSLMMLPDPKLTNRAEAIASVRRLAALEGTEAVLVGDGWPVVRDGQARLKELVASL